jgi:hypothetical protein
LDKKLGWKLTWHCCICCNPAKERVDFEDGWLIKSSFIAKDEMKLVSLPGPNSNYNNKKKVGGKVSNVHRRKISPSLKCICPQIGVGGPLF